jgi:hypothetical protein
MGCDIHGIFQKKVGDVWEDISSDYEQNRHYQLFAVLANVRNGFGFAGVRTGDTVEPISEPRGLPPDFEMVDGNDEDGSHLVKNSSILTPWRRENYPNDLDVWMGDHSHSWLTADEMLAWFDNAPTVVHEGVISRKDYEEWDGVSSPSDYCGGISGRDVVMFPEKGWTYIRVGWNASLATELAYFFDEVRKLQKEHGEVRFVFGFDS